MPELLLREYLTTTTTTKTFNAIWHLSAEGHDDGHDEVRQRRKEGRLGQVEAENVLEVLGLGDEEQVEGPRPGRDVLKQFFFIADNEAK